MRDTGLGITFVSGAGGDEKVYRHRPCGWHDGGNQAQTVIQRNFFVQ
jgi:hypothetical protein